MKRQQVNLLLHIGTALAIAWSMVPTMAPSARAATFVTLDPEYGPPGTQVEASGLVTVTEDESCEVFISFGGQNVGNATCNDGSYSVPFTVPPDTSSGEHEVKAIVVLTDASTGLAESDDDSATFHVPEAPLVDADANAQPNPDVSSGKAEGNGKADADTPNGGDVEAPAAAEADTSQTQADVKTDPQVTATD